MRAVALSASLIVSLVLAGCGVSSDSTLEKLFHNHEKEFEELRSLSTRGGRIKMITARQIGTDERFIDLNGRLPNEVLREGQANLSEREWRRFMNLMHNLPVHTVFIDPPSHDVLFRIDNYSILNGDSEKGITYSESTPTPLVGKLDRFEPPPHQKDRHGGFIAYKALKANWYLYFAR